MADDTERQMLQLIVERDAAEEAMSQAYYIVTGRSPEWSNRFGYAEALEEIGDAVALLKNSIAIEEPPMPAPDYKKVLPSGALKKARGKVAILTAATRKPPL